jgi:Ca2+-transporting ATPase
LGHSGVEAARRIADVVLVEDDLGSLADAVARGRAVAINIRKAIRYLLATNLSEIIVMLGATAAGAAQPLSPIQLLWINLVTDVLPALGLATDAPAAELMTQPPQDMSQPVVSSADFVALLRDASLMAASGLIAQMCTRGSPGRAQTVRFASLVAAQLFYAFACRTTPPSTMSTESLPPNPVFSATLLASFGAQAAALFLTRPAQFVRAAPRHCRVWRFIGCWCGSAGRDRCVAETAVSNLTARHDTPRNQVPQKIVKKAYPHFSRCRRL